MSGITTAKRMCVSACACARVRAYACVHVYMCVVHFIAKAGLDQLPPWGEERLSSLSRSRRPNTCANSVLTRLDKTGCFLLRAFAHGVSRTIETASRLAGMDGVIETWRREGGQQRTMSAELVSTASGNSSRYCGYLRIHRAYPS